MHKYKNFEAKRISVEIAIMLMATTATASNKTVPISRGKTHCVKSVLSSFPMNSNNHQQQHRHHHRRPRSGSHSYQQHQRHSNQICYIPKEVLADRILNNLPTIIIDARDDDVVGGMIQGAIYCPESTFTPKKMLCLLKKAKERRLAYHSSGLMDHKVWVIFHCMETIKRSVRCAKRFYNLVQETGNGDVVSVRLLSGGADGWIRSYWKDHRLVEGYDDKYWGYEEHDHEMKMKALVRQQEDSGSKSSGNVEKDSKMEVSQSDSADDQKKIEESSKET